MLLRGSNKIMKIAYFDCFSGIAGDMALAALLDCGAPLDRLKADLASLDVENWDIRADDVTRSGIHGVKVTITENEISDADELAHAHEHHHAHSHEHSHSHDEHHHSHGDAHQHDNEHSHEHHHHHEHHHGRSMSEIHAIIERSSLNENVKAKALAIFGEVARAEAKIHHSTPEEVHFHEIGGLDSLLDIVGVAWCLDYLGIEAVYASALPMSSGTVNCAHGVMPIPAPATLEILKGAPWTPTEIVGELVTPTGAGILAALCQSYGPAPAMQMETIGSGAGTKEAWGERPNLLRVFIGQASELASKAAHVKGLQWTTLSLLETNIDDMNPQLWEAVFDELFQVGALDVWTTPIAMKKGRPAQQLSVLGETGARDALLSAILRHTTTIGVRVAAVERAALPRSMETITTKWGEVRVKIAAWSEGEMRRAHPEWEDVKARALENRVAAREVYEAALAAAQQIL